MAIQNVNIWKFGHVVHFCSKAYFTQGSLVTVLRRGGQNYIRLQHVSLGCCLPNFITTSNVSQS